jgi:aspartate/methionine/tyrosine aminotransferase
VSKPRISARIAAIAESATLAVDAKAKALKAAGRPVIGFGAGEPDFPTPDYIVESAVAAAKVPANHRYSPTPGLPELREAIVKKTKRDSNFEITADQVLVTNGGKQAVYQAFATIVDKGDEVILPSPYWTTYPECIKLAGGTPVEIFADESQNYLVSVEQLEKARKSYYSGFESKPTRSAADIRAGRGMKSGGKVSASSRADGIAQRGKTKGRIC